MNEATLEGHLNATLQQIFPGPVRLKIRHQATFVLKLGHHDVDVDGRSKSEARGRLDVLLLLDETPFAVLELKRPDLALTADDEEQAWSYARLLHPMPPLYIVTNGHDTRVFRTYDKSCVEGDTLDEETIVAQFGAAAEAAAESEQVAIRCLLGNSGDVFRKMCEVISRKQLRFVMGGLNEMTQPVCAGFGIARDATLALFHALANNVSSVLTIYGDALAGKTNVAADLCHLSYAGPAPRAIAPAYVNCEYLEHGILQTLANEASSETRVPVSADDVRHWLRSQTLTDSGARPVLLVDSWSPSVSDDLRAELSELLDLAGPESFSIVVIVDAAHIDQVLETIKRGQPTKLGALSVRMQVPSTLNDAEVARAAELVHSRNRLMPELGVQHNPMYRLAPTWRMLAAFPDQGGGLLPATLGAEQLHNIGANHSLTAEQLEDVHNYCRGLLDERTSRLRGLLLSSPGWMGLQAAREALGEEGLARLRDCGLLRVRRAQGGHSVVTHQVPPLLAANAVAVVQERLQEVVERESAEVAAERFLSDCQRLPYCALVGAAVFLETGLPEETCESVMRQLLQVEPTVSEIPLGARLAILREGRDPVDLPESLIRTAVEEGCGYVYGDTLPYLIASHVLRLSSVRDGQVPAWIMPAIERVGSVRIPLFAVDFASEDRLEHATPVVGFELQGGGSVLSGCNGVIEPVSDALRRIALEATDDFAELAHRLLDDEAPSFPLLNRVWLAADAASRLQVESAQRLGSLAESLATKIQERCAAELGRATGPESEE